MQADVRNILVNNGLTELSLGEPDELEEKQAAEYSSNEAVGTSLGDLLKGLKL